MKKIIKIWITSVLCLMIFTFICGVVYTGAVTAVAQLAFPDKANGSVITVIMKDGSRMEIGSELIAQKFTEKKYMIGRPSGPSNLSPVSEKQKQMIEERIQWWQNFDPDNQEEIPSDLIMASGSGVDPDISPEAAEYQVSRIAKTRGVSEDSVRGIIKKYTTRRFLGFWGEPAVNVLKVNLVLDGLL